MKQIAVILGAINLANQKKILKGMSAAVEETGDNLYVFTNYVGTRETAESVTAYNRILQLPDFSKFDGVILAMNTIHNPDLADRLVKEIQEKQIPAVSIDRPFDGMSCVRISSYDAQAEMIEHLLAHGYREFCYVAGSLQLSKEAQLRKQAYVDKMEEYQLYSNKENIYEGMFTLEGGIVAAQKMLAEGKCPEAVICGNDDMAHGVIDVFTKAGYRIPEDMKVVGFDNGELGTLNTPTLTTVDKNQFEVGYRSVLEVLSLIQGNELKEYQVSCKLIHRESCGCKKEGQSIENLTKELENIKSKYVRQQHDTLRMSDVVRSMVTDLSKAHTPDELIDVLKEYVPLMSIGKFYLCLCEEEKVFVLPEGNLGRNIDVLQVNDDYTSEIALPLAYENGTFQSYPKFEKGIVLPDEVRNRDGGNVYVINQIAYQNCCYGYAVSEVGQSVVGSGLFYSWLMEIGVGLENIRKWMLLKDAVDRLNGMWCYDNLTYLYNRSGFFYEAQAILNRLKSDDQFVFILFMDADGLKTVNDTFGHEAGDTLIQELAAVIHKNTSSEMLAMRYGGDEFVLFGGFGPGEAMLIDQVAESIRNDMNTVNESGKYPFELSVSMGGSGFRARDVEDLKVLIEQADKQMYEEKRRKKMRR